jgi:hypothetical protein
MDSFTVPNNTVVPEYSNSTGYPSVNDIIKPAIPGKNFMRASNMYAYRGSLVHEVIRTVLIGEKISPQLKEESKAFTGFMEGIIDVIKRLNPKPKEVEVRHVDNELKYCGMIDFVGEIDQAEGLGIIDWKTSKAKAKWWKIQLSAYYNLVKGKNDIKWVGSVRIRSNGRKPLIDFYERPDAIFEEEFKPLLSLYNILT